VCNSGRPRPPRRGAAGDRIHPEEIERLQLTVTPNSAGGAGDDAKDAAVESIRLNFANGK
jgi:hypothetical protein